MPLQQWIFATSFFVVKLFQNSVCFRDPWILQNEKLTKLVSCKVANEYMVRRSALLVEQQESQQASVFIHVERMQCLLKIGFSYVFQTMYSKGALKNHKAILDVKRCAQTWHSIHSEAQLTFILQAIQNRMHRLCNSSHDIKYFCIKGRENTLQLLPYRNGFFDDPVVCFEIESLKICFLYIFSSIVPQVINRYMMTSLFWPIRYTLWKITIHNYGSDSIDNYS